LGFKKVFFTQLRFHELSGYSVWEDEVEQSESHDSEDSEATEESDEEEEEEEVLVLDGSAAEAEQEIEGDFEYVSTQCHFLSN
jgi:hypothetical protein